MDAKNQQHTLSQHARNGCSISKNSNVKIMKKRVKKFFYDLETTGVDHRRNGIHQLAGCIEIDGEIVESFNFKVAPNPKAIIEEEVLKVGGGTVCRNLN